MKKILAMLAVLVLTALAAAYVAFFPLAAFVEPGSLRDLLRGLDGLAGRLVLQTGRSGALAVPVAIGAAIAGIVALLPGARPAPADDGDGDGAGDGDPAAREPGARKRGRPQDPPPPEPWSPEPLPANDRAAGLRRRAEASESASLPVAFAPAAHADAPDPALRHAGPSARIAAIPDRPVVLVRKPRLPGRDWFGDGSWLGGLPRLAGQPWPREADGTPMPFAAQIDLAELPGSADDETAAQGSLAFFLGSGAVVAVPPGEHEFTDPPEGLPAAFEEGAGPFPAGINRLSRQFFPFWPVSPTPHGREDAEPRDHPFYASGVGEPVEALWWHGVLHLRDRVHEALEASDRPLAELRRSLERHRAAQADADGGDRLTGEDLADLAAELEAVEAQQADLPAMAAALDAFVAEREPWTALAPEEREIVAELLPEIHERYGELVRDHVPATLAELATLSLRAMVTGGPEAVAAIPPAVLDRINREYRLPPEEPHAMFAGDAGDGHIVLLQLGWDDMMEWRWPQGRFYQFRIGAAQALAGKWDTARLFEIGG